MADKNLPVANASGRITSVTASDAGWPTTSIGTTSIGTTSIGTTTDRSRR